MMFPVLIGWIIGVPLDIWWPRTVAPEHAALRRAYSLIRWISGCLLVSFALYIIVLIAYNLIPFNNWLEALGIACGGGAFMLSPLASCASALDVQRRSLAIGGAYGAALLTAGQAWFSFSLFLQLVQLGKYMPFWGKALMLVSTGLAAIALALVLELYTMVRRPLAP